MKNLRKCITLAVLGIAFCLGISVVTANAQRRGGLSINVSIGGGSRVYRPRSYGYGGYSPVIYRTRRPVYVYQPRNAYYYNSGYYGSPVRYVTSRSYGGYGGYTRYLGGRGSSCRIRRY